MAHNVQAKQEANRCTPDCPAPQPQQEEPCEGEVRLTGALVMPCCCPRLHTRSFAIQVGPQTEAQVQAYIQATVNAWEGAGYLIMAHSLTDIGGGWLLNLTVGWYA